MRVQDYRHKTGVKPMIKKYKPSKARLNGKMNINFFKKKS
jgi:hypothetical protein